MMLVIEDYVVIPKARPRLGRDGRVYSPSRKKEIALAWRLKEAALNLDSGYRNFQCEVDIFVVIIFCSSKYNRADIDNLTKFVYDALQESGLIENDKQIRREYHDIMDCSSDILFVSIEERGHLNFQQITELMEFVSSSIIKA